MDFGTLAGRLGKLAAEKSPVILTALGVTGTLGTAYLAAKGAFKSKLILDDVEADKRRAMLKAHPELDDRSQRTFTTREKRIWDEAQSLTFQEMFDATWKCYIPAAGIAALTVVAIIGANRMGTRRAAAMASAYAVVEKGFEEYRKKVADKIGKTKAREVSDEIAQERMAVERLRKNPRENNGSRRRAPVGDDKNCYDMFSDRRFYSTPNKIETAVNTFNQKVLHDGYASLSEFYHLLDMNNTTWSDEMGWNSDNLLEINITTTPVDDDPCFALVFVTTPKIEYKSFH